MSMEQFQAFFSSTGGQILAAFIVLLLFGAIFWIGRQQKTDTRALVISAVFVALYVVLNQVVLFRMPQGGSVTAFSLLPIAALGYLLGVRQAVLAGMAGGMLSLIFNPYVIHPIQLLLDYPLATGALGLAGLAGHYRYSLQAGYLIGVLGRYLCSFLSGVIFFGQYAPTGFNSFTWSLFYNLTYIGPEVLITLPVLFLPPVRRLFVELRRQTTTLATGNHHYE